MKRREPLPENPTLSRVVDEFRGLTAEEWDEMKTQERHVCPRCDYPLVPVHAVEGSKRRVIALSCPEPYCDHMQMVPSGTASTITESIHESANLRAAN